MVRTLITPDTPTISFDIPEGYVGKQMEVIAFALDEGGANEMPLKKKASFTVLHVNAKDYSFNRDEANER